GLSGEQAGFPQVCPALECGNAQQQRCDTLLAPRSSIDPLHGDRRNTHGWQLMADSLSTEADALTEAQNRAAVLHAILQTAAEGIITIDARGLMQEANPAAERIFGYSAGEMIGHNVRTLMPAPYDEEHDQYLANYLKTGIKKIIGIGREVRGLRKDGTEFPLSLSVSEVELGGGRLFTGIVRDLSERKKHEDRVAEFGRIVEESLNEIYVFDAETLKFLRVNRGARENLGYTMDELRHMTPIHITPEYDDEAFASIIHPLRTSQRRNIVFTSVHQRKDQSLYDVEVHVQLAEFEGKPAFVAIIRDVTERLKAEEALRREHEFTESLVQTAQAIVLVLNTQGRILQFNPYMEELSGYRLDEVKGLDWFTTFLPEQDWTSVREIFRSSLEGASTRGNVNTILTRDGSLREISWWDRTLKDGEGNVVGILAIGHDMTELRAAQKKLLQAERLAAIGEMAAGLAHESRNALQRSQASLEMLEIELEQQPQTLQLVHRVLNAQDHLHRLYEEVREYAAPISLDCTTYDLSALWRETWAQLEVARAGKDLRLNEQADGIDLRCEIDPFAIGQVFRNVLENSIVASPDDGEIVIRCDNASLEGRSAVRISFQDYGSGLSAEQSERLFEPFYTTKTRGTGLGMAICLRIMQAHTGRIEAGQPSGPGAQIFVTLPRQQP
ncbi:MAG: PAS domain S-box protein, partial [Planctomycetota bacterium]|nr:PAS domain S-box protein [Planctomycetota bacterium]